MNVMATRVDITTRNTRSDIVNEGKSTKSYVVPLSDASNKSSDSSISSSLIIEETIRVHSKPVSMFNTGLKPRLSPKPFTREKPAENRRTVGMLPAEMRSESDVPFQTSASISLSGSTKTEDAERLGRRIFTSSYQPDTDEDQLNKSEAFPSTVLNRKQASSSWMPTDIGESKSTSEANEPKLTSKPPMMSRKSDVLQQHGKVHAGSLRRLSTDATDEQKETPEKAKNNSFQPESMDSSAVRAQLRPKRRPVSAMFLDSVKDQTSDSKVTEKQKLGNRRPLSEDLTSLFESGVLGNKQSIFEETKENIPLRKSSLNSSFREDQSALASTVEDYNSARSTCNETRTVGSRNSSRNFFSGGETDDTILEIRSRTVQGKTFATGVESTVKGSVNDMQDSKAVNDSTDGSSSEAKATDDNGVAPGTMKSRISRYLANSSSSLDLTDSPTSKDKPTPTVDRKTRTTFADNDVEFGRPQTTSQHQMASVSKKFLTSSTNVEPKSEKEDEEKNAPASQDTEVKKEKKDWRTSEFSQDKFPRQRRSFRKVEEPLQLQDNAYKPKQYDNKTEEAEDKYKQPVDLDNTFRTVKATMFDHNVEWHRPPELLSSRNLTSSQPAKSDIFSESTESKKDTGSWSKWLSDDSVHAVTQLQKDSDITDIKFSNSRVGKAAPAADHDLLQKLKVDEKTRIEPRFEVIQAVGERVSSESIQMAPEDKAVTLRSGRSFHRKEKVLENSETDESVLRRPVSNLQRSKSEYRRRDTSSQESPINKFGPRDLDFPFNRKNSLRTAKSDSIKSPDIRIYETGKSKSTVDTAVSDLRSKSYIQDYKPKQEIVSEQYSVGQSPFGIGATDSKDMKKSLDDYSQNSHRLFSDSVEKGLETGARKVIDGPVGSYSFTREDIRTLPHVEVNKQSYERNRFLSNKESPATKKENKDESNYFISEMLSNEVEQFKKDLSVTPARKDSDSFLKGMQFKEEYTEQFKWERKEVPVQDRGTSSTGNSADLYNFKYEERKRKQNISPTNSKATYFAITGLDNKKEKNDSNFESQSSSARSWTSDEYFRRDIRMSTTTGSDSSSNKPEAIIAQEDLGTSSAFKESEIQRNQSAFQDDFIGKPAKSLEKKNVIDIDALIKRHKQKTSIDDKLSFSRDTKTDQKISSIDLDTTQGSSLKLDGSYKSKAIDIDSLMADYNVNPPTKESVSRNDDHSTSKWERSKSFKESASKSLGNKWRDPSVKHVKTDESYPYETVASWYSSLTTTSSTEGVQQDIHKTSSSANNLKSLKDAKHEQYREKRRDQSSQVHSEESRNIASLDSPQESTRNFENFKSRPTWASESPTDRPSSRTLAKTSVVESSIDASKDDPAALKVHHKISVKTDRKSILTEERQSPSEGRGPAKASDLISLMLENKEKRMEHHRARQSIPSEHQYEPRTHRQEWHHSESKNYFEKESSSHLKQEPETVIDLPRNKSLNRQRERDLRLEDHVKQCFSRSSTSNKDTDSLVQDPERQYGTWRQDKQQTEDSCVTDSPSYDNSSRRHHSHSRLSSLSHTETDQHDSITEARDGSLDRCSMDLDSIEGTESTPSEAKSADFSFIDQTSVLDSTALKNRVQLSRKSQRRAPSQLQRRSRLLQSSSQLAVIEDTDNLWMYSDSTEEKPEKKEEPEEEDEKPKRTSVHSPRMPVFPGMDQSTLMAQLRKRQDAESSSESSPQVTKSPKSPLPHGTLGIKLLPTPADKQDNAAGESPQWLKELKSKKRQSQYENHS